MTGPDIDGPRNSTAGSGGPNARPRHRRSNWCIQTASDKAVNPDGARRGIEPPLVLPSPQKAIATARPCYAKWRRPAAAGKDHERFNVYLSIIYSRQRSHQAKRIAPAISYLKPTCPAVEGAGKCIRGGQPRAYKCPVPPRARP